MYTFLTYIEIVLLKMIWKHKCTVLQQKKKLGGKGVKRFLEEQFSVPTEASGKQVSSFPISAGASLKFSKIPEYPASVSVSCRKL